MNDDLISRKMAIDGFYEMSSDTDHLCTVGDYVSFLESLSAQPKRKTGKWIETDKHDIYYQPGYKCSVCGVLTTCHGNYCPNCGADMRDKKDGNGKENNAY